MTKKSLVLGILLLCGASMGAQSQNPKPPTATGQVGSQQATPGSSAQGAQQAPHITVTANAVIVPVTVKNSAGQLVGDLQRDEFHVFADDVEQQVLYFSSDAFPLSAVVLIDNDLPQKAGEQVQKSLTTISAGFGPNDEVALVTYEEFPNTVSDFSTNNDDLFTKLKRLEIGTHSTAINPGPTNTGPVINGQAQPNGLGLPIHGAGRNQTTAALDDALFAAGDMLKMRGRDRRKIVFLISDGTNSRQNQHSFDSTLRSLLLDDVSVYSISVSHTLPLPVGKSIVERGSAELQKYAIQTGGDTFYGAKQDDLERLYSDVTEEARNQYTLTFQPNGVDRSHDYHTIEVRVRRPGLSVKSRQGYYQSAFDIGH